MSAVVRASLVEAGRALEQLDASAVAAAAELVRDALLAGKRVFAVGDAAVAQSFAASLVAPAAIPRRSLPALAVTDPRQLEALGGAGDVVVAFGAFDRATATAKALRVVELAPLVPAAAARAQECYLAIAHAICEVVDLAFVPEADTAPVDTSARASESLKEYTRSELGPWRAARKQRQQKVVWIVGTFDAIEARHLRALRAARRHGDVLLVGVRATAGRLPVRDRIDLLAALDLVDAIVVLPDTDADAVFAAARPDVDVQQSPD
ncbi:MAG TPA: hypothetical protein VGM88_19905 [Kofleriaceae bacterium]